MLKWHEQNLYDLYDPGGTYIGRIKAPFDTQLSYDVIQSSGDHVWATAKDDDGVESLVRYRIVWP